MVTVTLGSTGITVNKNGFGALPIQRVQEQEAVRLLRRAFDGGMQFFDTARFYTDSEKKLGLAFSGLRERPYIASKTGARDAAGFWKDLETSLTLLQTDCLDLYQFHNPPFCPKPGDGTGLYEAMQQAKREGKIRHIGITNHRMSLAREAIQSGLYETLQFPMSYLATQEELELVERCRKKNMGFIAMKALSGGLIANAEAAYAFLAQLDNVLPIWGIQREEELEEFLRFVSSPPAMTPQLQAVIDRDRRELAGNFCRGCGYCMPCPAGIEINTCARMSLLIRRAPADRQLTGEMQEKMRRIEDCLHCGQCRKKCPYGLDTPRLLEENYRDYREILAGKSLEPISRLSK